MKTVRVSATHARNNFFDLLNQVMYEGVQVIVQKAGTKREVVIQPKRLNEQEIEEQLKEVRKFYGILKDVPVSRLSDDRIRGKRAQEEADRIRRGDV